ncbi:hypothetical protein [Oricola thermophila]|uniref:Uncharacterized protein n=1 Tax=Oricola thermophila TaxID=2742145 RepID=A0A6N1VI37_9HYPH|nr:hypothetical protein [Oricola thermophila]QKV19385.1 hypothetical protein HTY61_13415 [Oricola thermophila]
MKKIVAAALMLVFLTGQAFALAVPRHVADVAGAVPQPSVASAQDFSGPAWKRVCWRKAQFPAPDDKAPLRASSCGSDVKHVGAVSLPAVARGAHVHEPAPLPRLLGRDDGGPFRPPIS